MDTVAGERLRGEGSALLQRLDEIAEDIVTLKYDLGTFIQSQDGASACRPLLQDAGPHVCSADGECSATSISCFV